METHNGHILSLPPHRRQQVIDVHIRSHLEPDERAGDLRRLIRGYDLLREMWEGLQPASDLVS